MALFKRLVVISDLHCGHMAGLTPPSYQTRSGSLAKFGIMQKAGYDYYLATLKALQPIDILVVNGDGIEGKGEKSGGTELIESDRTVQCDMAVECIQAAKAKKIIIIAGTPYHTGVTDDLERDIAKGVNACKFGGHEWIDVNGVIFDFKHKVGSSVIPHGRNTAINRDVLWNALWSLDGQQPRAQVVIRSHVHYHIYGGDVDTLAMTTPALQGYGSKYGVRQCSGRVHVGLVHFDVYNKGGYIWQAHIMRNELQKATALKL